MKKRKAVGDGKGNFRTVGQYSAATVRGTQVAHAGLLRGHAHQGDPEGSVQSVTVEKTIVVRKGKSYLAKAEVRLLAASVALGLLAAAPASAATFTVNTTSDGTRPAPATCTLRAALAAAAANGNTEDDMIVVPGGHVHAEPRR